MKAKSFTEKRKIKSEGTENIESELTMKKRRKHRAGKYSINEEVNVADSEDYIVTFIEDGETVLDVQCGTNKAKLTLDRLWQGSKGQCINFQGSWLTPNEFQYVSGRETAKDWKRSIRHQGKSIKLLLSKGYIKVTTDSVNDESKTVQSNDVKKKRRGKGRRRKTKSDVQQPVLVDIPGHLNGVHIPENGKEGEHDLGKEEESKVIHQDYTDDSHDGNETDETIENYYSENEYCHQKENANAMKTKDSSNEKNFLNSCTKNEQNDHVGTDYTQNKKTEYKDCNDSEKSSSKIESPFVDRNDNNQAESELNVIENVNEDNTSDFSEPKFNNVDIPQLSHHSDVFEKQQSEIKELSAPCVGIRISKPLMESSHEDSDVTGKKVEKDKTEEHSKGKDRERMDVDSEVMPDVVGEQSREIPDPWPSENDQDNCSTDDDDPPTLEPQGTRFRDEEMAIPASTSQPFYLSDVERGPDCCSADNVVAGSKKIILSLPLKNSCQMLRQDSDTKILSSREPTQYDDITNEHPQEPSQSNECVLEPQKGVENLTEPEQSSDNSQEKTESAVDSKVVSEEINMFNSSSTKISNKRKRKRSPKHVKKVDTTLQNIPLVTGPKMVSISQNDMDIDSCQQSSRTEKILNQEIRQNFCDRKSKNKFSNSPFCQQDLNVQQNIKINSLNKEHRFINDDLSMKMHVTNMDYKHSSGIDTSSKDAKQENIDRNLKLQIPTKDDKKSLINLSATVPRMNGEMRTRSPLQNSYDDYMRRLEASHSSMSWNPYFPFFQIPRTLDGMSMPASPFVSPYPPLLGTARKQNRESYPHSLKTPTSSPMQSPYIATSPPSFDIPRLPTVPNKWNGKDSFPDSRYFSGKSPDSKSISSSDATSSCLTIKPAHSVMPDSLCSNMKRSSDELDTPLDLSLKKTKIHHVKNSAFTDVNKNKMTNHKHNRNDLINNQETINANKHKKLKHLWINKTDSERQSIPDKCFCFKDNIEHWSVDQVCSYIKRLDGCSPYSEKFRKHNVSGMTLQFLSTDQMTRGMGMKVGPAIVLSDAITREVKNSRKRSMSCYHCSSKLLRDDHKLFV